MSVLIRQLYCWYFPICLDDCCENPIRTACHYVVTAATRYLRGYGTFSCFFTYWSELLVLWQTRQHDEPLATSYEMLDCVTPPVGRISMNLSSRESPFSTANWISYHLNLADAQSHKGVQSRRQHCLATPCRAQQLQATEKCTIKDGRPAKAFFRY